MWYRISPNPDAGKSSMAASKASWSARTPFKPLLHGSASIDGKGESADPQAIRKRQQLRKDLRAEPVSGARQMSKVLGSQVFERFIPFSVFVTLV